MNSFLCFLQRCVSQPFQNTPLNSTDFVLLDVETILDLLQRGIHLGKPGRAVLLVTLQKVTKKGKKSQTLLKLYFQMGIREIPLNSCLGDL